MITETKKQVNLVIAGRSYPVQIVPSEEEALQAVVAEVNHRIEGFQQRYPNQDKQDFLVMAMLTFATELHKIQHDSDLAKFQLGMSARLNEISLILDSYAE